MKRERWSLDIATAVYWHLYGGIWLGTARENTSPFFWGLRLS